MITFSSTPSIEFRNPFRIRGIDRQHPLNRGLVAAWNPGYLANGSRLYDMAGNADGVIHANAVLTTATIGHVLSTGINNAVVIPHDASLISEFHSVAAWVIVNNQADGTAVRFAQKDGSSIDRGWILQGRGDGRLQWEISVNGTTMTQLSVSGVLTRHRWCFVVATFDGAALRLYVDGHSVGNRNLSGTQYLSVGDVVLGGSVFPSDFVGATRIYSRALTADEIRALYLDEADTYTYDSIPLAAAGGGITPAHFESAPLEAI